MLTTILAIVTFLLLIAVAVFLAAVSSKQYEISQNNKRGIRSLRREDIALRAKLESEVNGIEQAQRRAEEERKRQREQDERRFTTESLQIGRPGSSSGVQAGLRRPSGDSDKNSGAKDAVHFTDRMMDRYAPIAAGKMWSSGGVMLDGKACLNVGVGSDGDDENGKNKGRICFGKMSEGLDIIGNEEKVSGGRGGQQQEEWEKELRKVYVHDFLQTKAVDTDYVRVKGGKSEDHNPDEKPTIFASKKDGKNYIRGDTHVKGKMNVAGTLSAENGTFRVKGGESELNPDDKPTVFANAEEDDKNDIRGDTRVHGHITGRGDLEVEGTARFPGAPTDVSLDNDDKYKYTAFNDRDVEGNVIRGDTHVSGKMTHHGDVRAKNNVNVNKVLRAKSLKAKKARFANDTDKNNVVIEGGKSNDGNNEGLSALNFNGDTDGGDNNFDSSKMRWRLGVDQRVDKDSLFIDRFGGGETWTPLTIEDGKIKIKGEVSLCDRDGENCRTL